jgi:hypothetical protein
MRKQVEQTQKQKKKSFLIFKEDAKQKQWRTEKEKRKKANWGPNASVKG